MSSPAGGTRGVEAFVADLAVQGCEPVLGDTVVRYRVAPTSGARAGESIETAVEIEELHGWPATPPHWVHFRADITFARTNVRDDHCEPGFRRHSLAISAWKLDREPILIWLAHVRGVLAGAV